MRVPRLAAVAILLAACGGGGSGTTTVPDTVPAVSVAPPTTAPEAAPPLEFAAQELADGIVAGIPVAWEQDERFPGLFRPPSGGDLDPVVTQYWVVATCGGACVARSTAEWTVTVEQDFFAQFHDADAFLIRRNEEIADGALILAENNFDLLALHVARWADGAEEMLTCQLSLPAEQADLVPRFEEACLATTAPILGG